MLKQLSLFAVLLATAISVTAQVTNVWISKTGLSTINASSIYGTGFSVGTKGYYATGRSSMGAVLKTVWEYDPATDAWTQKADFGGSARNNAVSFTIGSKGYIGTGWDVAIGGYYNDFWEFDPVTNVWTQKAPFPGGDRHEAIGFCIGNKGYLGTGVDSNFIYHNDLWEYNPATNVWTQKANMSGIPRAAAVAFAVSNKAYVGTGYDGTQSRFKDFWEYNSLTNAWSSKASLPGDERSEAVAFNIGNKGYVGTGRAYMLSGAPGLHDFYEYDPATNMWTSRTNVGGGARTLGAGFSVNNKGYIGWGWDANFPYLYDLYEYYPIGITGVTDLNRNSNNALTVNPRLSNGLFKVEFNSAEKNVAASISVINSEGATVYNLMLKGTDGKIEKLVDLKNVATGNYVVVVDDGLKAYTAPFILKR